MANFECRVIHNEMFGGKYNFKDEEDGTSGTDITFVDYYNSVGTCTIESDNDGHKKVLKLNDNSAVAYPYIYNDFAAQTSGDIELWIHKESGDSGLVISGRDGSNDQAFHFMVDYQDNGKFRSYYGGAWNDFGTAGGYADATNIHLRIHFDCATDTFSVWVDGILKEDGVAFWNVVASITRLQIEVYGNAEQSVWYLDAIGYSWDTDYNIGDNVYHRHYKESTDSFEGDDWGTQGTSITWVDAVDTAASVEIVPEFNAHKKVLRQDYTSGVGGFDYAQHNFASQAKDGWYSFWIKVADVTGDNQVLLRDSIGAVYITYFGIRSSQFQKYTGGGWSQISGSGTPVNDTWYHIYLKWVDAATDTISCWIDNVFYETYNAQNNQTDGVNVAYIFALSAGDYVYIDAPISSLDSDEIGDNWTYDYNAYSYDDDTLNVITNVGRIAPYNVRDLYICFAGTEYDKDKHFFQIYDKDSILGFEGDIKYEVQQDVLRGYYCVSKNEGELKAQQTANYSASKIYEILEGSVPSTNSRLHLGAYDLDTDTYSPDFKTKPLLTILREIAFMGNKVIRIKPNGIIEYYSGSATGLSISETSAEMIISPRVTNFQSAFTKVTVKGGIDPDTGVQFSGFAGSGTPEYWVTIVDLLSADDCANMATQILAGFATPKIISTRFQGVGAYSALDTITYAYSSTDLTVSSGTYYIMFQRVDYVTAISGFLLCNGVIESAEYNRIGYTMLDATSTDIASTIYDTDINTVYPELAVLSGSGSTKVGEQIEMDAVDEAAFLTWYISPYVDDARSITLYLIFFRVDNNADTVDGVYSTVYASCDGGANIPIDTLVELDLPASASSKFVKATITITAADVHSDSRYYAVWYLKEAAREVHLVKAAVVYYMKRSV